MYLETPATLPPNSSTPPSAAIVARKRAQLANMDMAVYRARKAVTCASMPVSMPSQNLAVDASIAQAQLQATLPAPISSFVSRADNRGLPQGAGYPLSTELVPVNGSGRAVAQLPKIWPQTLTESDKLIRNMQSGPVCGESGGSGPRSLPCAVNPEWGLNPGVPLNILQSGGAGVLSWIQNHGWLTLGIAGGVILIFNYKGGRR